MRTRNVLFGVMSALSALTVASPAFAGSSATTATFTTFSVPVSGGTVGPSGTNATGSQIYTSKADGTMSVTSAITSPNGGADAPNVASTYYGSATVRDSLRVKPSATGYTVKATFVSAYGSTSAPAGAADLSTTRVTLHISYGSCGSACQVDTSATITAGVTSYTVTAKLPAIAQNDTIAIGVSTDAFAALNSAGSASAHAESRVTSVIVSTTA